MRLVVVCLLAIVGCSDASKSKSKEKELDLRERELALREKEAKKGGETTSTKDAPADKEAAPSKPAEPSPQASPEPTAKPASTTQAPLAEPPDTYHFVDVAISVTVDQTKADGKKWDAGSEAAPDPVVTVRKTGGKTWNKNAKDSFGVSTSMSAVQFDKGTR